MPGPHEIAIGIASVLGKPGLPNPMTITFRGQSLESAADIVRAIVSECADASIRIQKIELDADLHRHLIEHGYSATVHLVPQARLVGEIRVFAA